MSLALKLVNKKINKYNSIIYRDIDMNKKSKIILAIVIIILLIILMIIVNTPSNDNVTIKFRSNRICYGGE